MNNKKVKQSPLELSDNHISGLIFMVGCYKIFGEKYLEYDYDPDMKANVDNMIDRIQKYASMKNITNFTDEVEN